MIAASPRYNDLLLEFSVDRISMLKPQSDDSTGEPSNLSQGRFYR
jgi:hypothetical protein